MKTATNTAPRLAPEQAEPAPRRDPIGFLLTYRIDWTDENQWFSVAGLVVTGVLGALLNGWLR